MTNQAIDALRERLSPEFLTFIVVRLAGVGIKPFVILVASLAARERFANDYALLVSALAGLFVLSGAQTHIAYYNSRFSDLANGYRHAFLTYLHETLLQYVLVLPFVALLALLWTHDPFILTAILLLVGVEKFFDEEMRHYQFTREYYRWSFAFAFRTILPALCVLVMMLLWSGRLILAYTGFSLLSLVAYGITRRRHFAFYVRCSIGSANVGIKSAVTTVQAFTRRWRQDLVFNQLWTFASANILLVDRMFIANVYPANLHQYVFFANLFNLVNVAHSLLYFVPRRPELIRNPRASGWNEIFCGPNILAPVFYLAVSLSIAFVVRFASPVYDTVSPVMFGGLGLFYLLQAIGLVGVEFAFWRVSRPHLLICDATLLLTMGAVIFFLKPDVEWVPYVTSIGLLLRILAYQWMVKTARERSRFKLAGSVSPTENRSGSGAPN